MIEEKAGARFKAEILKNLNEFRSEGPSGFTVTRAGRSLRYSFSSIQTKIRSLGV